MKLRDSLARSKIGWREFTPAFILVVNSFSWYSVMSLVFTDVVNKLQLTITETFGVFGAFYAGIAVSAVLGYLLFRRSRNSSLLLWLFLGVVTPLLFNLIKTGIYPVTLATSLLQGVSIGIGLPSCLAYFADLTVVENRGFLGGITYGFSAIAMFIFVYAFSLVGSSVAILLSIWRGFGLVFFMLFMRKVHHQIMQPVPSYSSIFGTRRLILYLTPWIMFCLINWVEAPIVEARFGDFYSFVVSAEFAISGIFALVGGIFADLVGRKRMIIAGFILLGIEYATLSLLPETLISRYLYTILDGASWGIFSVVFFMVLWGDLAENNRKEKHYVIGGLPYLLANFLSVLVTPYIGVINVNTAFSLASFFLFLAVLPLMYAPETLPEKAMKDRDLKSYTEKALKKAQKEAEKSQKKNPDETEKGKEELEETPENAEARKLAEKYY